MKSLYIFYIYVLSIKLVFGGCITGTANSNKPRLGIHTNKAVGWAPMVDGKLYANVFSGGVWKGWRKLDNSNCNDFQKDSVDYFNDFQSTTGKWDAISLYNCGNDAILIEDIYYWSGTKESRTLIWRAGVFGPFPFKCLYTDSIAAPSGPASKFKSYSDIKIDGNTECCDGVTFGTGGTGTVWTGALPGVPDCVGEFGAAAPVIHNKPNINNNRNVTTDFEQKLLNYLMIVIAIAVLLFVSNSCLITVMVKKGHHVNYNQSFEYGKANKIDIE